MAETKTTMGSTAKPKARDEGVPAGWVNDQENLASLTGLSLLLVEGRQPPALVVSNNNSICQAFQSSAKYGSLCDPYCGKAHENAVKAGEAIKYKCHAGLECNAVPLDTGKKKLAVIAGRAFTSAGDYRELAERLRVGDLNDLVSEHLLTNVIFADHSDLEEVENRIGDLARTHGWTAIGAAASSSGRSYSTRQSEEPLRGVEIRNDIAQCENLDDACRTVISQIEKRFGIKSAAVLLRERDALLAVYGSGRFESSGFRVAVGANESRLKQAASRMESIRANERLKSTQVKAARASDREFDGVSELFPLVVAGEVKGALIVADVKIDSRLKEAIAGYCSEIAMPLEVLKLRHQLDHGLQIARSLEKFSQHLNSTDATDPYTSILRYSTELLRSERGSLLVFDEEKNELAVKAAIGARSDIAAETRIRLGDETAGAVLMEGKPLVVQDVELAGRKPAPPERLYKTRSFISYPIIIAGRKVGVLNVTDKAGGGSYDEADLNLIETIAPQMALALDRAEWREKAAQFQIMSITDPLTGLLNRRYLEERVAEELSISRRYGHPMSFMMIDIDDFKHYNDKHGHQAGDLALEMTAQSLKSALRSADVAARYGGEEFCILLPQTALSEAQIIAERIRRRVERTRYPHGKSQPLGALTVSIGLASLSADLDTPHTIIGSADRALYRAKNRGKNRVETLDDLRAGTRESDGTKQEARKR